MKHVLMTSAAALLLVACGPSEAEKQAAREKAIADSLAAVASMEKTYLLDAANSNLNWTGTMLGIKKHHGLVALTDGKFVVKGGQVIAGSFTADMSTISPKDSAYAPDGSKQGTKSMLVGHLMSADFFDATNFPTATFEITGVQANSIMGNLTVRGKTNQETVTDVVVTEENGMAKATGKLTFDRQKYGVAWSSGSKDAVLSDNIDLVITLTGTAAN